MTKIQENEMAKKTAVTEQEIDQTLDEAGAEASLKPNSAPVTNEKSKPEQMAAVLGALGAMPTDWWGDHAKDLLTQYEKWKTNAAKGSAESNMATQNMKPSDAKGPAGPVADGSMKQIKGQPKPELWDATKEEVESIFGGEALTEDAQAKISALFEAAVSMKVSLIEAEINEAYEQRLTEEVKAFVEETKENLDTYIDYVVDQWIGENEVAIVDTLRLENAEEFMDKLKGLFVESYIDVPEERLDVVREMSEKVVELEAQLDASLKEKAKLEEAVLASKQLEIVKSVSEGLTLSDSEKLKTLIENVEFTDVATYTKKLSVIKEHYFNKTPPKTSGSVDTLNENANGDGFTTQKIENNIADPWIAASLRQLKALG